MIAAESHRFCCWPEGRPQTAKSAEINWKEQREVISLSKPSQFWLYEINFFILFWVFEQTDVWENQDQPHKHSCYIGSRELLSKQKSHKHRRSICGSAARLISAAPSANVPSLGALVLDLLPAFLQRLQEDFKIFVRFNPNQLFWEVDLKRFHWWDKQQLLYKKTPGVRSHCIKLMTFTKAQRLKTKKIILVQSFWMIGLFIHVSNRACWLWPRSADKTQTVGLMWERKCARTF